MSNKLTKRGYIVLKNTPLYYIPAFYIILYTGSHFFVAKIVVINIVNLAFWIAMLFFLTKKSWCITCNKWNVFQIPIMSPQVKETMLGQHSKHTLAQTVL